MPEAEASAVDAEAPETEPPATETEAVETIAGISAGPLVQEPGAEVAQPADEPSRLTDGPAPDEAGLPETEE